jgi:hypothetical protein
VNCIDPWGLVNWGTVGIGTLSVLGGSVTAVTGALASATGAGAIGGVAAVLFGTAAFSWGISQIIVGFLDDRIPFMGVKEAVIKGTTQSGLLQDELLGINSLGDILLTGRTLPTDIGKVDSLLQSGYSIYSSGSTIVDAMGTANSSIASSLCK